MIRVFYSYTRVDEKYLDELENHLKSLQLQGLIESWHDRRIAPGEDRANRIDEELRRADIVLFLVSSDFISSCCKSEIQVAMDRHDRQEAVVIPVILRPCSWDGLPFGKLQAATQDGKPVDKYPSRDDAFFEVTQSIKAVARQIAARKGQTGSTPDQASNGKNSRTQVTSRRTKISETTDNIIEDLINKGDDPKYQKYEMGHDSEKIIGSINDGYVGVSDAAFRLLPLSEVCTGCGKHIERYLPASGLLTNLAKAIPPHIPENMLFIARVALAEHVTGNEDFARECMKRISVDEAEKVTCDDDLSTILMAKTETGGYDPYLMERRTEIQTGIHGKDSYETAKAAKCKACRAVSSNDPKAGEYLDFAFELGSSLTESKHRKDILSDLEIINFCYMYLDGLTPKEGVKESVILNHIDKIWLMERGTFQVRKEEKLIITTTAAKVSKKTDLQRRAFELALKIKAKGKVNHCLFDLKALLVELGVSSSKESVHETDNTVR